ncbi:MAG: tRNA 2-thiouridine(34) synthase MnmA [Verrucomicrobia bacterium]|nr:tRNA 2-thiouridine(34) synthase MnmA [Verrucomicrobiota bacterium]
MKRILVAMSGGVDSSVAAFLLKQAGHNIEGCYMKIWLDETDVFGECPWQKDIDDARSVADQLGIPFRIVNLIEEYRERVVDYMIQGYQSGITPNPDVMCNREIKFGAFLEYAIKEGFDAIATGHYVQSKTNDPGITELWEGMDKNKDQSYFLALLNQDQAARGLFPVGNIAKPALRDIARHAGLVNADKKDSQGICFIGKIKIGDFLQEYIPNKPGNIVSTEGKVLGKHNGLHRFTLGQRKGMGIPSNADNQFYVVIAKDYQKNELVVAFESPSTPKLYTREVIVRNLAWNGEAITEERNLLAKPRYRDPSQVIRATPENYKMRIRFKVPQRALTPGQILAFYEGERLLGGGVYETIL